MLVLGAPHGEPVLQEAADLGQDDRVDEEVRLVIVLMQPCVQKPSVRCTAASSR